MEEPEIKNPFLKSFITTTLGLAVFLSAAWQGYFLFQSELREEHVNPQAWANIGTLIIVAAGLYAAKDADKI